MDGRSIKMAWESGGLWVWVERRKDADKKTMNTASLVINKWYKVARYIYKKPGAHTEKKEVACAPFFFKTYAK